MTVCFARRVDEEIAPAVVLAAAAMSTRDLMS